MALGYVRSRGLFWRPAAFLAVGAACFALQLAITVVLVDIGLLRIASNALGFLASAQVKFFLSCRFVWSDRPAEPAGLWRRFVSFNTTTAGAFLANTIVFATTYRAAGIFVASVLGLAASTVISYVVCDLLVFRSGRVGLARRKEAEGFLRGLPEPAPVEGDGNVPLNGGGASPEALGPARMP